MDSNLRIVGKTGVMWKDVLFSSRELLKHVGEKIVVDDLGVLESPEIMIKTTSGKMLCLAERVKRHPQQPFLPQKMGAFERAFRKVVAGRQSA